MTIMVIQPTVKGKMLEVTVRTAIMRNSQGIQGREKLAEAIELRPLAAYANRGL
jgi:hypothetical protein